MLMMVVVSMSMRVAMPVMIVRMIVIVPAAPVMVMMIVVVAVGMTVPHQPAFKPQRPSARSGGQGGGHRKRLLDPAEIIAHGQIS
jgi:hypothetical protein